MDAGGCAAVMRSEAEWEAHPAGQATVAEPPVHLSHANIVDNSSVPDLAMGDTDATTRGRSGVGPHEGHRRTGSEPDSSLGTAPR